MGALLLAGLLLCSQAAGESLDDAARDIARRVLAMMGPRDSLAVSTSDPRLEASFQRLLAGRRREPAAASLTITPSRNARGPLLVAELVRDEESTVLLAPYDSDPPAPVSRTAIALETRLIWEQAEPMLDVLVEGSRMAVLGPLRLTLYERDNASWRVRRTLRLIPEDPLPRDTRGRLVPSAGGVRAYLPDKWCEAAWEGDDSAKCDNRAVEWPLGIPAVMAPGRNHFTSPSLPAFYTAARWDQAWVVAAANGQVQLESAVLGDWGSDIATVEAGCSGERYLVGLRDGLQAFRIEAGSRAIAAGAPAAVAGRLAALWPSPQPDALTAIVESTDAGTYAAYRVSVACGR